MRAVCVKVIDSPVSIIEKDAMRDKVSEKRMEKCVEEISWNLPSCDL